MTHCRSALPPTLAVFRRSTQSRESGARLHRLRLHPSDLVFHPLRLRIADIARAAYSAQRAVPAGLIVPKIAVFLQMYFRQPFDVGDTVPARHDEAHRKSLLAG